MTPTLVGSYPRRRGSEKLFGGGSTIGERYEIDAEILAHYEQAMEKERLLGGGAGLLEYLRTRELLARHLPPAAATILDVGGGAGVYALPLAKEGYSVYLVVSANHAHVYDFFPREDTQFFVDDAGTVGDTP